MKRFIYILAVVVSLAIVFGGVSVLADYEGDNLTRVSSFAVESIDEGMNFASVEADSPTTESATHNASADALGDEADAVVDEEDKSGDLSENGVFSSENDTRNGSDDNNSLPEGNKSGDLSENGDNSQSADAAITNGESVDKNPFESFFEVVRSYATEIFCSLSLVCSLVLAYCYKKGLIPLLTNGISALSGVVAKVKESAERGEGKTDELERIVGERLTDAEVSLDYIGQSLTALSARLDCMVDDKNEARKMKLIMSAQIDMLYSIFMTSALPQYQKDEVGARIAEMKNELGLNTTAGAPLPSGTAVKESAGNEGE